MTRPVFGRVYELHLAGQVPDTHAYVGKVQAPTTIHQRVFGRSASAHTSPESIARDPWKARILPGRAGYRQLEVVYATGDPAEDDRALRRAEAFWIDRLRPTENDVRPVRPPSTERQPRPRAPRPAGVAELRRVVVAQRRRRRVRARLFVLAVAIFTFTYLSGRLLLAMRLPWPAAPWVVSPVIGAVLGWSTYAKVERTFRKLTR